ncbi:hypothetical protein BC941DRAFT_429363 [Chlamydoabsidia padenii]|nr:hypothetical protein BC941DRAFT_429363 [Chlamydoabsidia padenii]
MQMEDRIIQITQSHESLKIETGELKSILTRRNSVMEEITNLLLALASENNKITNLETVETIKKNMLGLREAMRSGFQTKERSSLLPLGPSRSTSTSPYLSSSDYDNNNNNNSRRSSIIRFNNNDSQYNNKSGDDRNKSGVTDAYRNDDGRQEGMPISSILSGSPPSTKQYEETEPRRSRRLPSIDVVCTEPFQAGDPPSPHYRLHHRSQEQQHFSSPSSPTSPSMADLDRPIPPLKPLRPLRSLLKVGDTRHHSRNSVDNLTPLGAKEPRSSSAYMRLGKESPLLNPGPSSRPEQPLYDYNETNDAKRSRPDHQVG